jgi:predicted AlkP superfamily pyrophosphatase or phosphodiesterase
MRSRSCLAALVFAFVIGSLTTTTTLAAPVLLISIDGLHPAYVLEADRYGLRIPQLRSFVATGTYASGVVGVTPTITYPSHTTLVTGVAPAQHAITSNTTFDPFAKNLDGWFWYAESIRVPTLWQAAATAGLKTASVNWPVTVGDTAIDALIPEYWRAANDEDVKLLRALSRPEGMLARLERGLGQSFVDGYTDTVESDRVRTAFSVAVLRESAPDFMATHLIALDGIEHHDGPFVASSFAVLEALDGMIGELVEAALANDPTTVVAIVSDHGFAATHTAVNLRTRFVDAGLIRLAEPLPLHAAPTIVSWDAQVWLAGGVAAVVLRDRGDRAVRERVGSLLAELRADERNGIARVIDRNGLQSANGFPEADFLVELSPGFYAGAALRGPLLVPAAMRGTHGYMPERPEMHASLFVKGRGVKPHRDLGLVDMRAIAPTIAAVLGVELPSASLLALQILDASANEPSL